MAAQRTRRLFWTVARQQSKLPPSESSPPKEPQVPDAAKGDPLSQSRALASTAVDIDELPVAEFAFPGPLRDLLVNAILSGAKTSTSGLMLEYEREGEPLPEVGSQAAVVDSAGRRVAVIEVTEVRLVRLADVDLQHALDEGEGYESVEQWRAAHEEFWRGPEMGDPNFTVDDDTMVVAERLRLVNAADR